MNQLHQTNQLMGQVVQTILIMALEKQDMALVVINTGFLNHMGQNLNLLHLLSSIMDIAQLILSVIESGFII